MSVFLNALDTYATLIGVPPRMHRTVPVRYIVHLNQEGKPVGAVTDTRSLEVGRSTSLPVAAQSLSRRPAQDNDGQRKAQKTRPLRSLSIELTVPDLVRTSGVKPKLFSDRADYTFGRVKPGDDPDKAARRHWAYMKAVQACAEATGEPTVWVVLWFLTRRNTDLLELPAAFNKASLPTVGTQDHEALALPEDFDDNARITFDVGGVMPIDLPSVQAHWADVASVGEDELVMQCQVCLRDAPPVKRLSVPIKGIPGGRSTGMMLISANAPAFESYGLEASLNSPICEECEQRVGTALNALLQDRDTNFRLDDRVFIFWSRDRTPLPLGLLLREGDPAPIRHMLTAARRGAVQAGGQVDSSLFYTATLRANGPRVVLLEWHELLLDEILRNLRRYFAFQRIISFDFEERTVGETTVFPLWKLASATVRQAGKGKAQQQTPPEVEQALLNLALTGEPLPSLVLEHILARVQAEGTVRVEQAALLRMYLLSQKDLSWLRQRTPVRQSGSGHGRNGAAMTATPTEPETREGADLEDALVDVDFASQDTAYLLGRLFVYLEDLQYSAVGDVNRGIRDRYLEEASTYPVLAFAELLKEKEAHLNKLRRASPRLYIHLEINLDELLAKIRDFPEMFEPEQTARFLLATHHQRLHNIRERIAASKLRKARESGTGEAGAELSEEELTSAALPVGKEMDGSSLTAVEEKA